MASEEADDDLCGKGEMEVLTSSEVKHVQNVVHELLGPDQEVVDVQKTVTVREEEVIMVNGTPIALEGQEGEAIRSCLLRGTMPTQDLLNHLLAKAGLIMAPTADRPMRTEMEVTDATTSRESAYVMNGLSPGGTSTYKMRQSKDVSRVKTTIEDENWLSAPLAVSETLDEADFVVGARPELKKVSKAAKVSTAAAAGGGPLGATGSQLVFGSDGQVESGSLEELIHELVPRAHSTPSDSFQFTFLLSSRLFLTPTRLMSEVYRRADQLAHMLSAESHPAFAQNLVQMISNWMVWFPTDFREQALMQRTRQLVKLVVKLHPQSETRLSQLMQTLTTHLSAIERHDKHLDRLAATYAKNKSATTAITDLLHMEYTGTIFAQELTRIELEHLCFLGPEELVHAFAGEKNRSSHNLDRIDQDADEARQRAGQKTRNLQAYVSWFNRLSFLVATTVVRKRKKKPRAAVIEFWIEAARECVNLGNFNSLMGIITGLNMTPVSRLKRTWAKIQASGGNGKFAVLEHQMDPTSNFLSYRSTLRAAISRSQGATDQRQRIVIPFFSLLVKDLYFVNEGAASRLDSGHINVAKARQLAESLKEFSRWKDVDCPYNKVPAVAEFLQQAPVMSEAVLDFESYECEQPELHEEKERYKALKHQFKAESH